MFVDLNSDTADVMDSLKKNTNHKSKKNHSKKNKCQLKLSSPPELLQSLTVGGIDVATTFPV